MTLTGDAYNNTPNRLARRALAKPDPLPVCQGEGLKLLMAQMGIGSAAELGTDPTLHQRRLGTYIHLLETTLMRVERKLARLGRQ